MAATVRVHQNIEVNVESMLAQGKSVKTLLVQESKRGSLKDDEQSSINEQSN